MSATKKAYGYLGRRLLLCAGIFLVLESSATFAVSPGLDVSQYAHTSWLSREGDFRGNLFSITQTADGYLWLGTDVGLLRFDGVSFVEWRPPDGPPLPKNPFNKVLGTREGSLWIGGKGLARLKDGKLTRYPALDDTWVFSIAEDHEGTVWIGGLQRPFARLCSFREEQLQCAGAEATFGEWIRSIHVGGDGTLWVGASTGLWRWGPGTPRLYPDGNDTASLDIVTDSGGSVITAEQREVRFMTSAGENQTAPWRVGREPLRAWALLRDSDAGLWIGTSGQGLVHRRGEEQVVYTRADGLSGNEVSDIFEDREGNIWAATKGGLDRFHKTPIPAITTQQGLSGDEVVSVLADADDSLWVGTSVGLSRVEKGRVTAVLREEQGLPDDSVLSMYRDRRGRILISTNTARGLAFFEHGRFTRLNAPGANVFSISEDAGGHFWLCDREIGLIHLSPEGALVEIIEWGRMIGSVAQSVVADPSRGGVWLASGRGDLWRVDGGEVVERYGGAEGVPPGQLRDLQLDPDGTVWAATEGGLLRLRDGRIALLNSRNGLPCDIVHWSREDEAGTVWAYTECGVIAFAKTELTAWADRPDRRVQVSALYDEVPTTPINGYYTPHVARIGAGALYFGTIGDGLSVIDPRNLSEAENRLPPPVYVQQVAADGKDYGVSSNLELPALARDLRIDFTALSFVNPRKVRFRYRLEGHDSTWHDAGVRRQAFYSNLPPGAYRFRVIACNNDGVWNEEGATLVFGIPPAWYQTRWFLLLCAAAAVCLVWLGYRWRVHHVRARLGLQFEGRLAERTRIAQDLHDTLLQGFLSASMQLHVADDKLPEDSPAKPHVSRVLTLMRQVIEEGRSAVRGLRSSNGHGSLNLEEALSRVREELSVRGDVAFQVVVEGRPQPLHPIIRDEVYRIGREALVNAFRHSRAKTVEVGVEYSTGQLRVLVRDDGCGIDPAVLRSGRDGHWGLSGMRERAERIDGRLKLQSHPGAGTRVELTVPGRVAFSKGPLARKAGRLDKLLRRGVGS